MTDNNPSTEKSPLGKVIVLLVAVFAMFLGAFIFFLSEGEPSPEEIALKQEQTAKELEDLQGKLSFSMENHRTSKDLLEKIVLFADQNPDLIQAQILRAQALLHDRQVQKAYDAFEKVLQMDPKLFEVEMLAGTVATDQLNDNAAAMKHYKAAEKLDPSSPRPPLYLAQLYVKKKQYDTAIQLLNKALELDRDLPKAHATLASIYRDQGKFSDAALEYDQALKLSVSSEEVADHAFFSLEYAKMLHHVERNAEALSLLSELPVSQRNKPEALKQIGIVWSSLGEPDQAANFFENILLTDPSNKTAAELAAKYYLQARDFDSAARAINKLQQIDSDSSKVRALNDELNAARSQ